MLLSLAPEEKPTVSQLRIPHNSKDRLLPMSPKVCGSLTLHQACSSKRVFTEKMLLARVAIRSRPTATTRTSLA